MHRIPTQCLVAQVPRLGLSEGFTVFCVAALFHPLAEAYKAFFPPTYKLRASGLGGFFGSWGVIPGFVWVPIGSIVVPSWEYLIGF